MIYVVGWSKPFNGLMPPTSHILPIPDLNEMRCLMVVNAIPSELLSNSNWQHELTNFWTAGGDAGDGSSHKDSMDGKDDNATIPNRIARKAVNDQNYNRV
jgi:hypothetical protein